VGNIISAVVFTVMALGEYYGDTLPTTPSRTSPVGVLARLAFAVFAGALAAHTLTEPLAGGMLIAAAGALIGTYGGYYARIWLAGKVGRDLPVALGESLLAIVLAVGAALMVHHDRVSLVVMNLYHYFEGTVSVGGLVASAMRGMAA
jgi:uncharacterized membrane protein